MRIIDNERGGVMIYVLMISLVLMVVTPTILLMTSNDATQNVSDRNQLIATNLAVSGMESFIRYLDAYTTGDRLTYLDSYPGLTTTPLAFTTPEGVDVTYSLQKAGPTNNKYIITLAATAGNANSLRTKSIEYEINGDYSPSETTVITDPEDRYVVLPGKSFYIEGTKQGSVVDVPSATNLSSAIEVAIDYFESQVYESIAIAESHTNKKVCTCSNPEQIRNVINNEISTTTANPIVLEISQNIEINQSSPSLEWGRSDRPVILIFKDLTINGARTIDIHGDIIANQITLNNTPKITINKINDLYGNLYVKNSLTSNNGEITLANMLYSKNLTIHNYSKISGGGKLIIKEHLQATGNTNIFFSGKDVLAGSITAHNNTKIEAPNGDLLIQNSVTIDSNATFTAGGSVAAGGNFTAWNQSTITTGGATTSLYIPATTTGGGDGSGSGTITGWNPERK